MQLTVEAKMTTFPCTSSKVRSFFTYNGLNQYLRICLRNLVRDVARDAIVTASQLASSASTNHLQGTTESQQRQNTAQVVKNVRWAEQNLRGYLKRIKMHMNILSSGKKKLIHASRRCS